eukprot:COSAG01_NODE_434_length_17079_cov_11.829270_16_plen_171_part_00
MSHTRYWHETLRALDHHQWCYQRLCIRAVTCSGSHTTDVDTVISRQSVLPLPLPDLHRWPMPVLESQSAASASLSSTVPPPAYRDEQPRDIRPSQRRRDGQSSRSSAFIRASTVLAAMQITIIYMLCAPAPDPALPSHRSVSPRPSAASAPACRCGRAPCTHARPAAQYR